MFQRDPNIVREEILWDGDKPVMLLGYDAEGSMIEYKPILSTNEDIRKAQEQSDKDSLIHAKRMLKMIREKTQ